MLAKVGEPKLDSFRVAILDLYQPPQRHAFKVLLRLLKDEMTPRYGPSLRDTRQRYGASCRESEIVRRTEGKVCEELQRLQAEGAELQVTRGNAVFRFAFQRFEVQRLEGTRVSDGCCVRRGRRRGRAGGGFGVLCCTASREGVSRLARL